MTHLKGKAAVVTGASSGIGEATALQLAGAGAKVYAVARRKERLEKLQKQNSNIIPIVADVSEPSAELESLSKKTKIDILVNNAGLALGSNSIMQTPTEDWQTMLNTNVAGLIRVTQIFLPPMIERRSGDIVNIGSITGYQTYAGGSVYAATKFAVRALTEAWRKDVLGKNIRIIGVHPGMVETEFTLVRTKGDKEKAKATYQGMRALSANDIANSILWALQLPEHVTIESLLIMPTDQAAVGMVAREQKN